MAGAYPGQRKEVLFYSQGDQMKLRQHHCYTYGRMFTKHENGEGTYYIIYLGFRFVLILGRNK
jgi:hypothetical protein